MNILVFDTCFGTCTVAVGIDAGGPSPRIVSLAEPMATGHAERLVPMIGEALAAAGIGVAGIDRIAVAHGPGTFTGTRIAVSAARALALAADCPIVALSSLEIIAHSPAIGPLGPGRDLAVAMSANRGEVYYQLFDGQSRTAKSAPMLLSIAAAAAYSGSAPLAVIGSGAELVAAAGTATGQPSRASLPEILASAGSIVVLASRLMPLAQPLSPLYLRPPDAKPQDGKSLARAQP